jgi:drug/metabolite transporter (DMT)-like permease
MKEVIASLTVATLGCVIYHAGQKAISPSANPMGLLMAIYAIAFLLAALALPFFRAPGQTPAQLHWPVFAVGLGVILIEGGFLLAYRYGGSLQWSGVVVNAVAALVLVPLAVFLFREKFSLVRALGILVTLSGMALMARK